MSRPTIDEQLKTFPFMLVEGEFVGADGVSRFRLYRVLGVETNRQALHRISVQRLESVEPRGVVFRGPFRRNEKPTYNPPPENQMWRGFKESFPERREYMIDLSTYDVVPWNPEEQLPQRHESIAYGKHGVILIPTFSENRLPEHEQYCSKATA